MFLIVGIKKGILGKDVTVLTNAINGISQFENQAKLSDSPRDKSIIG